jgi:hypothetical protein
MSITIYGDGPDLIAIGGVINDEFAVYNLDPIDGALLAVSNGVVIECGYNWGVWRFTPVSKPGDVVVDVVQAPQDDDTNCSDRCTISGGNIAWVVYGTAIAR